MGYSDVPKPKVSRTTDNVEIRRASESGNPRGRSQGLAATPSERSGLKIRNAKPGLRGLIFDPALLAFSMLPPTQSPRPPSNAPSYQWCSCGLKIAKFSKSLKSESATCARTSATLISPNYQSEVFHRPNTTRAAVSDKARRFVVPFVEEKVDGILQSC